MALIISPKSASVIYVFFLRGRYLYLSCVAWARNPDIIFLFLCLSILTLHISQEILTSSLYMLYRIYIEYVYVLECILNMFPFLFPTVTALIQVLINSCLNLPQQPFDVFCPFCNITKESFKNTNPVKSLPCSKHFSDPPSLLRYVF